MQNVNLSPTALYYVRKLKRIIERIRSEDDTVTSRALCKSARQTAVRLRYEISHDNSEKPIDFPAQSVTISSKKTTNKDYGVKGMKWGERKSEEDEPQQEGVKKTKVTHFETQNGTMKVTEDIKARLGKGTVFIMSGEITDVEVFAGKGAEKPLELANKFAATYGGSPEDWTHSTGNGKIKLKDGVEKNAEIHWFECEGIGQTKWKVKKFKKGN